MKVIQGLFLIILTAILSVASFLTAAAFKWSGELPELVELYEYEFSATSQIYARDGQLIGEILPAQGEGETLTDRIPVTLEEVSPAALMAIIASEDDQYFKHFGFDIPAIIKAFYLAASGDTGRGGSTITTQVIKNTVLEDIATVETVERKAKELLLAIELERRLTKSEILEQYINVSYWGQNYYGIRAAAKAYFNKDPLELSLAEGLYLARLIPSPARNYQNFKDTRQAMRNVLDNMVELGIISQDTADRAWLEPIEPVGWRVVYDSAGNLAAEPAFTPGALQTSTTVTSNLAPHVTWAVRNELSKRYGQDLLFGSGGLKIYTTIDVQMQEAANAASLKAASDDDAVPDGTQLAIVGVDFRTGEILAMVGERLYEGQPVKELNRAISLPGRQPGSSFKPIVVATAIEQGGYTQADVIVDEPITIQQAGSEAWKPANHNNTFEGAKTIREHLNTSRNIPIAKLIEAVGSDAVADRATELGYQNMIPVPAISLGSIETTPLQHASAIGAFANGGVHIEPFLIARVEDAEGNVLFEAKPRETRVWSEQTAYIMLDILHGNVVDGTGFSNRANDGLDGRWVAGKTGTTNNDHDIWFVGLTPEIVSAVWIGFDEPAPIPKRNSAGRTVNSSRQPVWVWRDFVKAALQGAPTDTTFEVPPGIDFKSFDRISGLPGGGTMGAFLSGTGPSTRGRTSATALMITIPVDRRTGKRASADTPREYIEWRDILPNEINRYL